MPICKSAKLFRQSNMDQKPISFSSLLSISNEKTLPRSSFPFTYLIVEHNILYVPVNTYAPDVL